MSLYERLRREDKTVCEALRILMKEEIDEALAEKIAEKDAALAEKDAEISALKAEVEKLKKQQK